MTASKKVIRVLFLLQRPEAWINIASIWHEMHKNSKFKLTVLLLPYNFRDKRLSKLKLEAHKKLLISNGIPYEEWRPGSNLKPDQYDVAFFTHPYDRERPRNFWFNQVRANVNKIVYVPYGLSVGAGAKNLSYQYAQPLQRGADLIVARSPAEKSMYAKYCPVGDHHVQVLGHPRFDYLLKNLSNTHDTELEKRIDGRLTILWNSHFSFGPRYSQSSNFSTFDLLGPELFDYFIERSETHCLIWRPHPGLLPELIKQNLLSQEQIPILRKELELLGIVLDEQSSHLPAFAYSHAMLSDPGTFLFEYLATGKPFLPLINPEGEPLNIEASEMISACGYATSFLTIKEFIEGITQDRIDNKKYINLQKRYLPIFLGSASVRICEALLGKKILLNRKKIYLQRSNNHIPPTVFLKTNHMLSTQNLEAPTLYRLQKNLRKIRDEKKTESLLKKTVRKYVNNLRAKVIETVKNHSKFLHLASVFSKRL